MVLKVLLGMTLLTLPFLIGSVFKSTSFSFTYLIGQVLMWAVFQVIAVPLVYYRASFTLLFWVYTGMVAILTIVGVYFRIRTKISRPEISVFLIIAIGIILYQCCVYVFGMHLDEDDARWLAEANDALVKDKMLLYNPATGKYIGCFVGEMEKDVFSPWAFYIAWTSRITMIQPATMSHTVYPPALLVLSYMAYWEMGKELFSEKTERGIFILMVSIINLFFAGNAYTQSVFTLTRIWQGKAVVAAIVIPILSGLFLKIQSENTLKKWLGLILAGTASCLFSGMGIAIGVIMSAIYGLCVFLRMLILHGKQSLKTMPLWLLSMAPGIMYGLGYSIMV